MLLKLAGGYLLLDAVASLIKFRGQPLLYQLIRVGRGVIGVLLLIFG